MHRSLARQHPQTQITHQKPTGDASGPTKLFVYFQPLSAAAVAAATSSQPPAPTAAGGLEPGATARGSKEEGVATGTPELFLTEVCD